MIQCAHTPHISLQSSQNFVHVISGLIGFFQNGFKLGRDAEGNTMGCGKRMGDKAETHTLDVQQCSLDIFSLSIQQRCDEIDGEA